MGWHRHKVLGLTLLFLTNVGFAQTLVEEVREPIETNARGETFTETIKIISASKKIFVLTNNNQQLTPGDFITLVLSDLRTARALVAKTYDGQVGVKIMKIFSLAQWNRLSRGQEIQIVRGDDSMFIRKDTAKPVETTEDAPVIKDEDDLFNKTAVIEDDLGGDLQDDSKRHIKPDNVVGIGLGFLNADDAIGGEARGNQFAFNWGYQFADNWFAEGTYARTGLNDFPGKGANTVVNTAIGRLKYNFKAPLYSFIMPYIGFQSQTVSSPSAGKAQGITEPQIRAEQNAIADLEKAGVVVGVTILRRLVPGWFLRADLGSDVLNLGVAIEF